jgi:Protein of unknown function (DUF2867)
MTTVTKVNVPEQSLLAPTLSNASFYDAYQVVNSRPERSPLQIWIDVVSQPAPWVERAMDARNKVVSLFGLKTGDIAGLDKAKAAMDYKVGDQLGIFRIYNLTEYEVIMGDDDKHLDVRLSLYKSGDGRQVTLSTVVHVNNFLGRVYMFFVTPGHRIIAPFMAKKV